MRVGERLVLLLTAVVSRTVLAFTADRPFLRVDYDRSAIVILNPRRALYMPTLLSLGASTESERSSVLSGATETTRFNAVNSKSNVNGNSNATVAETPENEVTTTITPPRVAELESLLESTSLSEKATTITTTVYGIRHGTSVSNEWMTGPNAWGAPTYDDRLNIRDSPLSAAGIAQAKALCRTWQEELQRRNSDNDDDIPPHWLSKVQLIVLSPLTRCLQTYQYAIQPLFLSRWQQGNVEQRSPPPPRVVVQPLLAERLYTRSETGRPVSILRREFPGAEIDWSLLPDDEHHDAPQQQHVQRQDLSSAVPDGCWWYHPRVPTRFTANVPLSQEWRPHEQGQVYGDVAGEPWVVFERRMQALSHWLHNEQPETCILTVGHWGVYRHLASIELDNGQVCNFTLPQSPTKLPNSSL
jgi:broad specificity phosphatase PhoE